eukprot:SAG31_NODE_1844_length_7106_cov_3.064935_3_plen_109_part_00
MNDKNFCAEPQTPIGYRVCVWGRKGGLFSSASSKRGATHCGICCAFARRGTINKLQHSEFKTVRALRPLTLFVGGPFSDYQRRRLAVESRQEAQERGARVRTFVPVPN